MTAESELMREQYEPIMERQSQSRSLLRFGNYDLVHRIDVGGMGEVYLARQRTAFDREVAIKIIRSDLVHDITARTRFLREAEVSSHLKHEHILPMIEFGEEQGRLFLVTPYIEGGTLARHLQKGPLSFAEVHQLFVPLVQAVAYIHRRGVVHRDLKPTNILLDQEDGQVYVRLIDFGIASLQGRTASPPLTTAGTEMGTVAYMAPERLSGVAAPSNDIYSLGIILYQLLTGQLPSVEHRTRLPQPLEYVIHRCIATSVEDRFASADELLKAFEQAYQQLRTLSQEVTMSPAPAPKIDDAPSIPISRTIRPPKAVAPIEDTSNPESELVTSKRSAVLPAPALFTSAPSGHAEEQSKFVREDYNAPTTTIGSLEAAQKQAVAAPSPIVTSPKKRKKRKRSLMAMTSFFIVLVLLAIGGLVFYEFQAFTFSAVTIQFAPQTHLINQVYTITAKPGVSTPNASTNTIPAKVLSSTKTGTQTGSTTGQQCTFFFDCQQSVAASDVDTLSAQVKQTLITQIRQDLLNQAQAAHAHLVGPTRFADLLETANPPVGTVSNTVTVTLKEQGSVEYVIDANAQSVARQLLTKQTQALGPNYILLSQTIRIGQPAVEAVDDTTGNVTIKIAAGAVAEYQFPSAQLQALNSSLKGKSLNAARSFLTKQPGIDAGTITIHFTQGGGQTLPNNVQHIRILTLNPTSLPVVNLPTVPTPPSSTSP